MSALSDAEDAKRIVVIGVGNTFRSDDGVGHRVLDLLGHVPGVEMYRSSGEPSELIDSWAGTDLAIVVDATVSGAAPGRVDVWEAGVDDLPVRSAVSSHATGISEAWALATALGSVPQRLLLVGVEVASLDAGTRLSDDVSAALPGALRLVRDAIGAGA